MLVRLRVTLARSGDEQRKHRRYRPDAATKNEPHRKLRRAFTQRRPTYAALQLFGAIGHFLIIIACLVGFSHTRPSGRQWAEFFAGGVIAVGYLLVMVWTVGPPEGVEHIKQALGL